MSTSDPSKRPLSPTSRFYDPPQKLRRHTTDTLQLTAYTRFTSHLERLPVELLESIFFYCLNVSLPQASFVIGQKLASMRVKTHLVFNVLSTPNSSDDPSAATDSVHTLQEQAKAQSAVLRLRWMTLPLLKCLCSDYIVKTILRELAVRKMRWMGNGPVVTKESEPAIRQYLAENAVRVDHDGGGLPLYWEHRWYEHSPKRQVTLGCALRDGLVTLHECDTTHGSNISVKSHESSKWRIIRGVEGCQMPEKLLHGPWTDEKCEFLEMAIRGNAQVDKLNSTSGEVGEQGLWQAIEANNVRAVKALVTRIGPNFPPADWTCNTLRKSEHDNDGLVRFASSYHESPVRRGVGIIPRQEHLRRAVLGKGSAMDIVEAFSNAAVANFDFQDIDILNWVDQKMRVGDPRGRKLQNLLAFWGNLSTNP